MFWSKLRMKLSKILKGLTSDDKELLKSLCKENKAEYFGLI